MLATMSREPREIELPKPLYRHDSTGHDGPNGVDHDSGKQRLQHRFSLVRSTEENYQCLYRGNFVGAYGHLRKKLDYHYHGYYRKERQWLHDSLVEDFMHDAYVGELTKLSQNPWLIFTVGCQGAGKIHTFDTLFHQGSIPLLSYVHIDPDEIRRLLPEYSSYVEDSPHLVDALTQKECGFIAETLTLATLRAGRTAVLDCCLKDGEWYRSYINDLRKEFPLIKVGLMNVIASLDTIRDRCKQRAKQTGRDVPDEVIIECLQAAGQSVEIVKPLVDYFCTIRNEDSMELQGDSWENFRSVFDQVSIQKPDFTKIERLPDISKRDRSTTGSFLRKSMTRRRFSVARSSEDNHRADHMEYYGQFAHIREGLDYSYHQNYTFERQLFQDAIIHEFLNGAILKDKNGELCTTPTEPWIVFTAGAMGAGKGYTMRQLVEKGRFPLLAFVSVDPDEIRRYLPEFHIYVQQNPELAGELTRKEAGFIAEILTMAGLQAGKNVLVDGSLRDSEWYKGYFARLRQDFENLKLAIIHVTAPREAVFKRASERALTTGRVVPKDLLVASLEQVPKSVKELAPLVDYAVEINNPPEASDVELVTEGETWESFESQWMQTCAWVPSKRHLSRIVQQKAGEGPEQLREEAKQ